MSQAEETQAKGGKVPDKVFLEIVAGMEKASHQVEKARITLGLHDQNDIVLDADGISNFHAEVLKTDEGWQLKDLGSTNGSYVNGQRVALRTLENKDKIVIGKVLIRYADAPPVPPIRMILMIAAAVILALLLGSFVQDMFKSQGPAGEEAMTPEQQEARYNSMMDQGLDKFLQKDFETAEKIFLLVKRSYSDRSAPNHMLQLCDIFKEQNNPATLPWEKMESVLQSIQKDMPKTEKYQAFIKTEIELLDIDRACAQHIKIILAPDTSPEDQFRVLNEAGKRWPKSRVYKLFAARLIPVSAELLKKYAGEGDAMIADAKRDLDNGQYQQSGEKFLGGRDLYKKAKQFDLDDVNRELDEKIKRANENTESYNQFDDAQNKAQIGQTEEAIESFQLVRFGTAYYTSAQGRIADLRAEGQMQGIVEKYLEGDIQTALERLRRLKPNITDRGVLRDLTRLESKFSRIERAFIAMNQHFGAQDYRQAIESAQMILDLEREERSGNYYINEATRIQTASRRELDRLYTEATRKLTDALREEKYADVKILVDDARKFQLDAGSTETEDRVRDFIKPLAVKMARDLARLRMTGGERSDPVRYKNLRYANQLIIDFLNNDPEMAEAVTEARKNLGQ